MASWGEFILLRRTLDRCIGRTGLPYAFLSKPWIAAGIAAGAGWGVRHLLGRRALIPAAIFVLGLYGALYFAITFALGLLEARALVERGISMIREGR